jgi:hypothetical protein
MLEGGGGLRQQRKKEKNERIKENSFVRQGRKTAFPPSFNA